MIRRKHVTPGEWRTLESMWNVGCTAFFRFPAGARIKVRYGVGWFGSDAQKQTLDGDTYKRLSVGWWSVTRARLQMRVDQATDVTYDFHPGDVAVKSPEFEF
jgi:hypothetical protein